ncbi:MAG: hypothetical protein QM809_12825 [Gordonia sp. (in: high G+C Gram-positive bacteria)]|uniref:hypothetical protein n=1 Tax=Gordonia sp. (in: high G+C Gram-positive bacteria) TaxID=84139 RepID=UPI0039E67735
MGTHESGRTARNRYAVPVLAGVLLLMLVVALVVVLVDSDEPAPPPVAASSCAEGELVVPIAADPALAPALEKVAESYSAQSPEIDEHCVSVQIRPADARGMLEGLTAASWDPRAHGELPAAWIPESSIWLAAVGTVRPTALAGGSASLVHSPVRLAVEPVIARVMGTSLGWSDLPRLTRARALQAYDRGWWGSLRMAMPRGAQSDATALAAHAVAAGLTGARGPLTAAQVTASKVATGLAELVSAPPRPGDGSAEAAVAAIAATTAPSRAPVRAVPISEQRLYALTVGDARAKVAVLAPRGPTPVLDYPVAELGGPGVTATMKSTVARFLEFARRPEQMRVFTRSGFRGAGRLPASTATVTFGDVGAVLPMPQPEATVAISRTVLPAAVAGS